MATDNHEVEKSLKPLLTAKSLPWVLKETLNIVLSSAGTLKILAAHTGILNACYVVKG